MVIKIFGVLIALFTIIFTILTLQDPYSLNLKSYSLNFKNMEASNLNIYETNSSTIKAYYKANSWERYNDKDVFHYFTTLNFDFNLSANTLELLNDQKNKIVFEGNVSYSDLNGTKILSQKVKFNPDDKILSTDVGFKAFLNKNRVDGNILVYDLKKNTLQVEGVQAWIQEK
ncbi:LPS export ABC transporter periplasmic protein LptC [Campylobacter sp. 2018MI35]|uniref:LPS export ABC transporter periplasmic protein LptC n=1 Tax=unclassified Campylobacter TaxID=2593542 RepID=UPI001906F073|nr:MULTISPECIES: LPS export ABC transporter periplasmic protein LptC [unclassified Campylobacter]MBK1972179.1 LPS export ABC transporter periplasmic protein LptC [Campylobacter sp. TTU_617]MBK1991999.1 LPS export ABC transporter periplasmic protein LptC [Campylobacter sp. 2018MI34]